MNDPYQSMARRHLDNDLAGYRNAPPNPSDGWIQAVRQALGMSTADLAARVGVTPQAIRKFERAEAAGTIGLATLQRVATALDARLVYAIVPNDPLDEMVDRQAQRAARHELEVVDHSMALEQQRPDRADNDRLIAERARELRELPGLWKRPT